MSQCPHCGTSYYPNTLYCETCGMALMAAAGRTTASASSSGPAAPAGPGWLLSFETDDGSCTQELRLGDEPLVIGRVDGEVIPALNLADWGGVELGVSRRHVRLLGQAGQIMLEDLGSANGTWINGTRLPAGTPYPLRHGDQVRLGKLILRVNLLSSH